MSVRYKPVAWNTNKLRYDVLLLAGIVLYIWVFLEISPDYQTITKTVSGAIYKARAFGTCAFLMLTLILCIGPLARLDTRFLPLLYNRRHFGVMTCAVALIHVTYVLSIYYSFSPYFDKYVAVLGTNTSFGQLLGFPFEAFGLFALVVLIVMAVTSHDFWLSFLTPPVWKAIHMLVYAAYLSIVLHVSFGALQADGGPVLAMIVAAGVAAVASLQLMAGLAERRRERAAAQASGETPWVIAGDVGDIPENRAVVVSLAGDERVAVFRYDGKLSAVANVCAHQNGPLGEGRIIGGCVTCPWHGFQFNPADGCAPAPFTEKIPTYRLKLDGNRVLLDPTPLAPGSFVEPLRIAEP